MIIRVTWLSVLLLGTSLVVRGESSPDVSPEIRVVADGVQLTLVAEHPEVVTPTGIDVDAEGNLWVVLSHTHFRPDDYQGPEHDQVVVISKDGSRRVFYDKTDATMDLELGPQGWVYLAERDRILRVRDTDGDGMGDQEQEIAVLRTEADYPHNGLSGLAWHPGGDLVFALGENFWKSWTLTSRRGEVKGTGEGGIFRCDPDGSRLRRIAKGFWNPFGVCVREDGTIFAAENDPGARPPCRLLHVVEGGDYGYQRLYGNSPVHPFVCWNGELRGTLPMMHSVGEAPCGIAPLANGLVVPSWTDHRIDFYPLTADGASFRTRRIELVEGGRQFRPTCIVQASPTEFYLTDWVYGSYKLHGYGRVWKMTVDREADWLGPLTLPEPTAEAELATRLRSGDDAIDDAAVFRFAKSDDPFLARAAIDALAMRVDRFSTESAKQLAWQDRVSLLLAIKKADPQNVNWIEHFWRDDHQEIQFETLRWIADENVVAFQDRVAGKLTEPAIDYQLFEAALAASNILSGNPTAGVTDAVMLINRVKDVDASPQTRAFALRLLDPNDRRLSPRLLDMLMKSDDKQLIGELTRTLVASGTPEAKGRLLQLAGRDDVDVETRADAIAGLSGSSAQPMAALLDFAESDNRAVREEALRSLRFSKWDPGQRERLERVATRFPASADLVQAAIDPESLKRDRPPAYDTARWQERLSQLAGEPDRLAGRRIFHHSRVGTCANCHRHRGRGNVVGPDLSKASNEGDPDRLLKALLEPSRDVDPQYYPWTLLTEDGHAFTGILLRDGGGGTEYFRDSLGRERKFSTSDIVARKPLKTSMMPDGLIELMTDREIRDLLEFLDQQTSR